MARPRPRQILWAVSEVTGIDRRSLVEHSKFQWLVEARWMLFWIGHRRFGYPKLQLARLIGRDHATVIHGIRRVDDRLEEFRPWLEQVEKLLAEPIAAAA